VPATISFSANQQVVTIQTNTQSYTINRPVVSPWNYQASGSTYYVATNGSDTNNGSLAHPFASIAKGIAAAQPGDIVYVEAGTYVEAPYINKSGLSGKPIILSCAPGALGQVTVVPPQSYVTSNPDSAVFTLDAADYVWINGFIIEGPMGQSYAPASEHYGANGITFENKAGLGDEATNNVIYNNVHCGIKEMNHGGQGIFIQGNVIFGNGTSTLDHGIYMPAPNSTLDGNVIFNNTGWGIHLYPSPANQTITHNILFNNGVGGILLASNGDTVMYNTAVNNNTWGILYFRSGCTNNIVEHNIFADNKYLNADYDSGGPMNSFPSNNIDDYNCYYPGQPRLQSPGQHELYANPQFLNLAADDFRLASGTAASADGAYVFPVSIGSLVWNDLNDNGIQDPGESGLNGVTVNLLDSNGNAVLNTSNQAITTTTANNPTTGAAGYYQFSNLPPGSYEVQFVAPAGDVFSMPAGSAAQNLLNAAGTTLTSSLTLTSGQSLQTINAGVYQASVDVPPSASVTGLPANNTTTEGTALKLSASAIAGTPAENAAGFTYTWSVTKVHNGVTTNTFASGTASGATAPINFTVDDEGTYTLTVTATDVNGAVSPAVTQVITATAVAPTAAIGGPADGVPYQTRQLTLTASSPSPVDQAAKFTFAVNWGDGTTQTITDYSGTVASHAYSSSGTYVVSVEAIDSGGTAGAAVTQSIVVQTIEVQNDPTSNGGSVGLAIGGTAGNDNFVVSTTTTSGVVAVSLNGTSLGTFTPTGGLISLFGGPGTDTVTFQGTAAGAFSLVGRTLAYTTSSTTGPQFNLTLAPAADIEDLVVQGSGFASTYTVQDATIATAITAYGSGDVFTFADTGAATQPVTLTATIGSATLIGANLANSWLITGSGSGTLQAGSGPVNSFSGFQNLTGGSAADTFLFANNSASIAGNIDGKGGTNTLDFSGRSKAITATLVSSGLNRATAIGGTWTNIQDLVGSTATADILYGPNTASTWTINGTNAGSVAGVAFSGFENLTGGSAGNTFAFTGSGKISGNVNGGIGSNTFDVSGYTSPATINLAAHSATPVGGTGCNFSNFVGDNKTTTLIGFNASTTWNITATNTGTVGSYSFSGIANLTGGTGNDTFKLANGKGVTGTINGGAGTNTIDESAYLTGATINLVLGTATNVGGVTNIQNAIGGAGNDILVGTTGTTLLQGGNGSNLLIADSSAATLIGGTGGNLLIGGTTSYDSNATALAAILATWDNTSTGYSARVATLMSASYLYQLDNATVKDNGVGNLLTGGSGQNLYFAHLTNPAKDSTDALASDTVIGI
jgi:parallel beta-helix repeat protein